MMSRTPQTALTEPFTMKRQSTQRDCRQGRATTPGQLVAMLSTWGVTGRLGSSRLEE